MNISLLITLIAFIFVAVCLLTGKIPGSIACGTAVVILWSTHVITEKEAFANFVSSSIIVMVCMMIVTAALMRTDIMPAIADMVRKAKGGGITILLAVTMIVPYILCQFVGGVTSMIIVIPLAMALAKEAGVSPTAMVLPASVGAQAGLLSLPIGGGAAMYLLKNQLMAGVGVTEELGFWDLFFVRMPGTAAIFLFILLYGWKLLPQRGLGQSSMLDGNRNLEKSTLPQWKQNVIYAIFLATMVLLSICGKIGLTNTQVSLAAAMIVMLFRLVDEREAYASVNWPLIFMMSFMLSISTALGNSGAGEMLAGLLSPVYGSGNMIVAVTVTFIFCAAATQFMDNMTLVNILTPICALACVQNGMSALPVVVAIDASCLISFSTPLASPSSLLAYQLGGYNMKEMLKFNLPLIFISTVVSCVWIPVYISIIH